MRIVFIGAVEFSHRALHRLIEIHADVVGVCALQSSAINSDHRDLSELSAACSIPWVYAPKINCDDAIAWISTKRPDVIFCFGWSYLLGPKILKVPPLGVVGFHPTALPANRGRHPLIWALALGLKETASTYFFMDEAADSGDILSQKHITIEPEDDAGTLYEKVTTCALSQLEQFVPQLESGTFTRIPQDPLSGNTWRKRSKVDGQIDWRMSARSIRNLVRALAKPYVGAHFVFQNQEIKVWKAELVADAPENIEPGKVFDTRENEAVVKCGEQAVRLVLTEPCFTPRPGGYL